MNTFKSSPSQRSRSALGMTLIELTVVILMLLSLISVLMIGASAWKSGAEKAGCILNINHVQKAARSYQNMSAAATGSAFDAAMIVGPNNFVNVLPVCKSEGAYGFVTEFPEPGNLFMTCSINTHRPSKVDEW